VDLECYYRPVGLSPKVRLTGRIRDISLGGTGIDIPARNTSQFSHVAGDSFVVNMVLPNGKGVELEARIVSLKQGETPEKFLMGMSVTGLSENSKKLLGFFLMP
jgi:hypothetical protein